MERPSGAHSYRYGPGARQRKDLEYGLLEAVFEDRAALEAAMDEFLGSHGKIAAMITNSLRTMQHDIHTLLGQNSAVESSRMSQRQDPVSMTIRQAEDAEVDQELQDAINRTFDHLVDGKYHGPEDEDDPLETEDMTAASRAAVAAGIPKRNINEVEIYKVVEEMLRKFLQDHALPILMQKLPLGEPSGTQYPDLEELEYAEKIFNQPETTY